MKVTAYVVDDEPVARAGLCAMLAAYDWVEVVGEAADGEEAVAGIDALRPALVFLDVQMPELLGTEVLPRVQHRPFVVFTTAYSEHAVTAFELGAVDYLLKPFGPDRLATTMERVRSSLGERAAVDALERLSGALSDGYIDRLFVRIGGALVPVPLDRVSRFEADREYVAAYAGGVRYLLHLPLTRLETRLDPRRFMRIHRGYVINLDHLRAFRRDERGNMEAQMLDGARVPVSRARAQEIKHLAR